MALSDTLEQLQSFDLADLDLNNIGSWPGPVKIIVMLLVAALVVGGGYYLHITKKQDQLAQVEAKEQELRRDFEKKWMQAANLEAYLKQKEEMQATFGALLKQLPKDTEVPGLLEDITRTALDNELRIGSIELEPERTTEFYVELPIKIEVDGAYHKLGSFVSGVANLSRIVTLHDFDINPAKGGSLTMSIDAKTYRYLDDEEG
ncbi:MAG: type 4a pilus biogenesis protein PilO [Pseudomonadota bacterium]